MNRRDWIAAVASFLPASALLFWLKPKKLATAEQENLTWGTYGKDGCHYPIVKWKKLVNCDSDHLLAILRTQDQITEEYYHAIVNILRDRRVPCKVISQHTSSFLAWKMSSGKSPLLA